MKIMLQNPKILIDSLKFVSELVSDICIKIDRELVNISCLDNAKTMFFKIDFSKDYFNEYEVDKPESLYLSGNQLYQVLTQINNNPLEIMSDYNYVTIISYNSKGSYKKYKITQINDYLNDDVPIPAYNSQHTAEINFKEFLSYLKDSTAFSEKVKLSFEDNNLLIEPDSEFTQYTSVMRLNEIVSTEKLTSKFSLEKLMTLKAFSDMAYVEIGLDNDRPCTFQLKTDGFDFKILLAHMIDIED